MAYRPVGRWKISLAVALAVASLATAQAQTTNTLNGKVTVGFSYTTDAGWSRAVYVVGNHEDVGGWDPAHSRKLYWTSGNVWTGQIAITAGTDLEYKYVTRFNTTNAYCDPANVEWMPGPNLSNSLPAQTPGAYTNKGIYYHSGWTNAFLVYQCGADTNWYARAMTCLGAGRYGGEYLYYVDGLGRPGDKLTFIPNGYLNSTSYWDHCPVTGDGNYYTWLDVLFVQDGQIYNYWPPASVAGSRFATNYISSSWAPTIPSRNARVYLPRGYDTNTWKRYPVLYMHDGQNVFRPGGMFGCWYAEDAANYLISLGLMRETIIVGVDNTDERLREYIPPGDNCGFGPGTGDQYANFLIHNVRPTIDTHYRTRNDPANTAVLGSSLGGLISAYLGLATNVYGKIGPMSPSYWAGTNFVRRAIIDADSWGLRIYMDCGTIEGDDDDMWAWMWAVYDCFLEDGYVDNEDLVTLVGCGQQHTESAWAARIYDAFPFLLNPRDEANQLAQRTYPPALAAGVASNGAYQVVLPGLKGQAYRLERATNLFVPQWRAVCTSATETALSSLVTLQDTNPAAEKQYYRVIAETPQ